MGSSIGLSIFILNSSFQSYRSQYEFSFYTMETDGILMSANMKSTFDYESVYLSEGKIFYIFNAGAGALVLSSKTAVNDGKWHKVLARRSKRAG